MKRISTFAPIALAAFLALTSAAPAAGVKIGDKAPDWSGLQGVDDKEHGLSDYAKAKAVAVVFTCNHCPVAVIYEDRLIALQKDYQAKGVQVVAINVNEGSADSLEKMKERSEKKSFNFPYLYDASQKSAVAYGATCTPHVFLLDQDRKVVYMGAIDDQNDAKQVKHSFLRDAIDATLDGKEPPKTVTRQRGCGIKWAKKS